MVCFSFCCVATQCFTFFTSAQDEKGPRSYRELQSLISDFCT